ncbi:MAG TPA: hypothetical protein VHT04_01975 [Stellaceae bacterium]|nr:hypothetical protein [Stellaceae bacterium]
MPTISAGEGIWRRTAMPTTSLVQSSPVPRRDLPLPGDERS